MEGKEERRTERSGGEKRGDTGEEKKNQGRGEKMEKVFIVCSECFRRLLI